ncbi:MAG: hypothetical protein A2Z04_09830 [Chloroflexi bacterium RBG_16_57_9]|nr:MAG: hypothetical protein A2Z04_09830 [Chloroflexi bacterium RBG_16_57_9]
MNFEIIGEIANIETIARGTGVRARRHLNRTYGRGDWRKMKGIALIRLPNGQIRLAELHWYEAHGIGQRDIKRKRFLET